MSKEELEKKFKTDAQFRIQVLDEYLSRKENNQLNIN